MPAQTESSVESRRPLLSPLARAGLAWGMLVALSLVVVSRAPAAIPAVVLTMVVTLVAAYRRSPPLRAALERLDLRAILVGHGVRLPIGVAFLVEHARGVLPATFAVRAGWGDIAAGLVALALAVTVRPEDAAAPTNAPNARARALVLVWNALALLDILMVVATANFVLVVARDVRFASTFAHAPYALLPAAVVPLVIVSHLFVFARVRAAGQPRDP